jgi:hypothetical protein
MRAVQFNQRCISESWRINWVLTPPIPFNQRPAVEAVKMSKFIVLFVLVTLTYKVNAQTTTTTTQATTTTTFSPQKVEECATKTYAVIKGYKGNKDDLYKKIDEFLVNEIKSLNLNKMTFNEEYFKRVADSVAKKITKDDAISAEEFRRFADLEIQKLKFEAAKKS